MDGFIALAGIQSFFSGLILSNSVEKEKRDFEMRLIETEYRKKTILDERKNI